MIAGVQAGAIFFKEQQFNDSADKLNKFGFNLSIASSFQGFSYDAKVSTGRAVRFNMGYERAGKRSTKVMVNKERSSAGIGTELTKKSWFNLDFTNYLGFVA